MSLCRCVACDGEERVSKGGQVVVPGVVGVRGAFIPGFPLTVLASKMASRSQGGEKKGGGGGALWLLGGLSVSSGRKTSHESHSFLIFSLFLPVVPVAGSFLPRSLPPPPRS